MNCIVDHLLSDVVSRSLIDLFGASFSGNESPLAEFAVLMQSMKIVYETTLRSYSMKPLCEASSFKLPNEVSLCSSPMQLPYAAIQTSSFVIRIWWILISIIWDPYDPYENIRLRHRLYVHIRTVILGGFHWVPLDIPTVDFERLVRVLQM